MATDRARPSETAAAVLVLLGAITWIAVPIALALEGPGEEPSWPTVRLLMLVLGSGLGALAAARALPTVSRGVIAGSAALAAAAVFAFDGEPQGREALGELAGACMAAFAGAVLAPWLPARLAQTMATAAIEVAVLGAGCLGAAGLFGLGFPVAITLLLLPLSLFAGGAVATRLVPGVRGMEAAWAWVALAVTGVLSPLLSPPLYRAIPILAVVATCAVPFAAGLAASGASVFRRRSPDLAPARAVAIG